MDDFHFFTEDSYRGGGAGSSGFGSDVEGHSTVIRDSSHPTSPCCRHHQFLSKPQSEDECECEMDRQSCAVEVGSSRPPSSPSPDFIGSDTSSPSNSNQNPEILLSLCGGLKGNRQVSDECFMLSLITFDEFCEDPEGILANPDLVVKVGSHYYTWLVAAPVLLSMGAFGRPLPSAAVNVLLNKHQPESEPQPSITESRKKSTGVSSWFFSGATPRPFACAQSPSHYPIAWQSGALTLRERHPGLLLVPNHHHIIQSRGKVVPFLILQVHNLKRTRVSFPVIERPHSPNIVSLGDHGHVTELKF